MCCAYIMNNIQNLLGNRLGALANAISDRLHRELIPTAPASNVQISVLVMLHSFPGMSIEDMSQTLDLSHSNLVRVVQQAQETGLLEKRPGKDKRATALHPTPAGEAVLTNFYQKRETQMQAVLGVLTPDEQQSLASLIDKLLTNFPDRKANEGRICRYCDLNFCYPADCPMHPAHERTTNEFHLN